MHLYQDQFMESKDFPRVDQPSKILVIASTGRSGSHMLGHALYETGHFGFPLEYVNPGNLKEWKRRLMLNELPAVMKQLQARRTSPNGVFGIKVHYPQIEQFGGFSKLIEMLPNAYFLLLTRRDVLRQAVSLAIAEQTGVWISGQKPYNTNPRYDFQQIRRCLQDSIINAASWRYLLAASDCRTLEVDFDWVRYNLPEAIQNIASFMKIELDPGCLPTEQVTKKQSGNINDEWRKRFLSDFDKSDELLAVLKNDRD